MWYTKSLHNTNFELGKNHVIIISWYPNCVVNIWLKNQGVVKQSCVEQDGWPFTYESPSHKPSYQKMLSTQTKTFRQAQSWKVSDKASKVFCLFFLDLSYSSDTERMLPCWQSHERFSFRHTYVRETMFCHAEKMGKAPLFLAAQCTLVMRGTDKLKKNYTKVIHRLKLLSRVLIIQTKMRMRKQLIGISWSYIM